MVSVTEVIVSVFIDVATELLSLKLDFKNIDEDCSYFKDQKNIMKNNSLMSRFGLMASFIDAILTFFSNFATQLSS